MIDILCSRRKIPWRLSPHQKYRHRQRLRAVDKVVETVANALAKKGETLKAVERWQAEMPTEAEMLPKDKYTIFDRKEKKYRKGIHSMLGCRHESSWDVTDLLLQNYQSGLVSHKESTLLDIKTATKILWLWEMDVLSVYDTIWNKPNFCFSYDDATMRRSTTTARPV